MVRFYRFLNGKCNISEEGSAKLVLLVSMILWFVAGCGAGLLVSLMLPEYRTMLISSCGSFFAIVMGFLFEMVYLLKHE